jgi:hypothetical protein
MQPPGGKKIIDMTGGIRSDWLLLISDLVGSQLTTGYYPASKWGLTSVTIDGNNHTIWCGLGASNTDMVLSSNALTACNAPFSILTVVTSNAPLTAMSVTGSTVSASNLSVGGQAVALSNRLLKFALSNQLSNYALSNKLWNCALGNQLSNYALGNTLSSYALGSTLSNYALTNTLLNYALSNTLSNYALSNTLSYYCLTTTYNAGLSGFALTSGVTKTSCIVALSGSNYLLLGVGVLKQTKAIGYRTVSSNLDSVGAGTSVPRSVWVWDQLGAGGTPSYPLDIGGNARLNNAMVGDCGFGSILAAFGHQSRFLIPNYSLLSENLGTT